MGCSASSPARVVGLHELFILQIYASYYVIFAIDFALQVSQELKVTDKEGYQRPLLDHVDEPSQAEQGAY